MPREATQHLLEKEGEYRKKEIADQEIDGRMRVVVRGVFKQRDQCQQYDDWTRVSDLALNVPAIRFVGAHARGRISYAASLAVRKTMQGRLARTVFQIATRPSAAAANV